MTNVRHTPFHGFTPWGPADHVVQKADGIWFASTPSHGGIWISPDRLAVMPAKYQTCSLIKSQWFENGSFRFCVTPTGHEEPRQTAKRRLTTHASKGDPNTLSA